MQICFVTNTEWIVGVNMTEEEIEKKIESEGCAWLWDEGPKEFDSTIVSHEVYQE